MQSARRWGAAVLTMAIGLAACGSQDDGPVGRWRVAAPMLEPRAFHGMVVLPLTGEVLVMGGVAEWVNGTAECLMSAEIYDPATGIWRPTAPMLTPRSNVSPVLLDDGTVLVAGGVRGWGWATFQGYYTIWGAATAAAEVFDPASETWTSVAPMAHPHLCLAQPLPDGTVMCPDGWGDVPSDTVGPEAEIYEPVAGTWRAAGANPGRGWGMSSVRIPGGRVVSLTIKDLSLYEHATGTWTKQLGLPHDVTWPTMTALGDGTVLIAGGCRTDAWPCSNGVDPVEAHLFDPARPSEWRSVGPMPLPSFYGGATLLPSGRVLVVGGNTEFQWDPGWGGPAMVFDPRDGTWALTPVLPRYSIWAGAMARLPSGEVLLTGGLVDDGTGLYPSIRDVLLFRE